MGKQISIIIPTYNMEEYIGKCLDSLLIPELDRVEVWVVNDGSKDKSLSIAREYESRYPNSIKIIDKPNGNYGSCINAALPLCTGRYVKVLDADDSFDSEAFSRFVRMLESTESDVVISDYIITYDDGTEQTTASFKSFGYNANHTYSFDDVLKYIEGSLRMHCVAYKLDLLKSIGYKQTEGISYTDNEWIFAPISIAKTFTFIDCGNLYRYLMGRAGQTMDPNVFFNKRGDQMTGIKTQARFYENSSLSGNRKRYLESKLAARMSVLYNMIIESCDEEAMMELSKFDCDIEINYPKLYTFSNTITYTPRNPYKIIKAYRSHNRSVKFKISRTVSLMETLVIFLSRTKQAIRNL